MKILMVAPEAVPFVKVGGLADVVGSLAKALSQLNHDVRIIIPKYQCLSLHCEFEIKHLDTVTVELGNSISKVRFFANDDEVTKVKTYFIENLDYFENSDVYHDFNGNDHNNGYRFAFFSRAALDLCNKVNWYPDIVHCHDWTTGLIPAYLNTKDFSKKLGRSASLMTIHNLQHQGYCEKDVLNYAGIPTALFREDGFESYGKVNLLKGGIYHSTKINTVSPTYSIEIQDDKSGFGLANVTRFRSSDLFGILNGIDTDEWDPERDNLIARNYSISDMSGKKCCKKELQKICKFRLDEKIPFYVVISRLYEQKGLDLLLNIVKPLVEKLNIQIAIVGTGDKKIEASFSEKALMYKDRFYVNLSFDNDMAHKMISGGDFIIMPSRFEPCGLSQMYAMRYGTIPIARNTGGLIDSVKFNPDILRESTGFKFENCDSQELFETISRSYNCFNDEYSTYEKIQKNCMKKDFSWFSSAEKYAELYESAINARKNAFI